MRTFLIPSLAILVLALAGCGKKKDAPAQGPHAAATSPDAEQAHGHAPPGAKPGSYEDWCGGHQVPESMCTRCNASLIPAFKATGDWCKEHKLPESQCFACNPGLKIERPPRGTGKQR
jgi:hypothetical protein